VAEKTGDRVHSRMIKEEGENQSEKKKTFKGKFTREGGMSLGLQRSATEG